MSLLEFRQLTIANNDFGNMINSMTTLDVKSPINILEKLVTYTMDFYSTDYEKALKILYNDLFYFLEEIREEWNQKWGLTE